MIIILDSIIKKYSQILSLYKKKKHNSQYIKLNNSSKTYTYMSTHHHVNFSFWIKVFFFFFENLTSII
jgi:hypothetical protein